MPLGMSRRITPRAQRAETKPSVNLRPWRIVPECVFTFSFTVFCVVVCIMNLGSPRLKSAIRDVLETLALRTAPVAELAARRLRVGGEGEEAADKLRDRMAANRCLCWRASLLFTLYCYKRHKVTRSLRS